MTIYASLDASNQPFEIAPGEGFHAFWLIVEDADDAAYHEAPVGSRITYETSHAWGSLALWDDVTFEKYGVQRLADPVPPEGKTLVSYTLSVGPDLAISVNPTFA